MPTKGLHETPLNWAQRELTSAFQTFRASWPYPCLGDCKISRMITLNLSEIERWLGDENSVLKSVIPSYSPPPYNLLTDFRISFHELCEASKRGSVFLYNIHDYKPLSEFFPNESDPNKPVQTQLGKWSLTNDEIITICQRDPYAILYPPIAERIVKLRQLNDDKARNDLKKMLVHGTPKKSGKSPARPESLKRIICEILNDYKTIQIKVSNDPSSKSQKVKERNAINDLKREPRILRKDFNLSKFKRDVEQTLRLADSLKWFVRRKLSDDVIVATFLEPDPETVIHPVLQETLISLDEIRREISMFREIQIKVFPNRKYPDNPYSLVLRYSWQEDSLTLFKMGDPQVIKKRIQEVIDMEYSANPNILKLYKDYLWVEADVNYWNPYTGDFRENEILKLHGLV
jgi:hypothetical protein